MPKAKNMAQLEAMILVEVQNALMDMQQEVENTLKEAIDKTVYSRPESWYERTYTLRESVDMATRFEGRNQLELSVFNNRNKVSHTYPSATWDAVYENGNQDFISSSGRTDNWGNDDGSNGIIQWLNDGHGGLWNYSGSQFIEIGQVLLEDRIDTIIRKGLKKRGLDSI